MNCKLSHSINEAINTYNIKKILVPIYIPMSSKSNYNHLCHRFNINKNKSVLLKTTLPSLSIKFPQFLSFKLEN